MNVVQIVGAIVSAGCVLIATVGYQRDNRYTLAVGLIGVLLGLLAFGVGRATATVPRPSRPGSFRVYGVDRETQEDTVIVVSAASEANARAKAELQGVLVTQVQRA